MQVSKITWEFKEKNFELDNNHKYNSLAKLRHLMSFIFLNDTYSVYFYMYFIFSQILSQNQLFIFKIKLCILIEILWTRKIIKKYFWKFVKQAVKVLFLIIFKQWKSNDCNILNKLCVYLWFCSGNLDFCWFLLWFSKRNCPILAGVHILCLFSLYFTPRFFCGCRLDYCARILHLNFFMLQYSWTYGSWHNLHFHHFVG